MTPESKVPHQTPILLLSVTPDASNNGCVVGVLLYVTQRRVVAKVRGVEGEEKRRQHRALGGSSAADHSVRRGVLQPDVLWPVSEVIFDPVHQIGVHSHPVQFALKYRGLDGIKGTGEVQEENPHCAALLIQFGVSSVSRVEDGILHTNIWLVRKLQAVLGVLCLGSEEAEEEPLQCLH